MRINQPLRSKNAKVQFFSSQNPDQSQLSSLLEPIKQAPPDTALLEHRITSNKVGTRFMPSNLDRRTSASTFSRGISAQQKFRKMPQQQSLFAYSNNTASKSDSQRPKEFLPLRVQGRLRVVKGTENNFFTRVDQESS